MIKNHITIIQLKPADWQKYKKIRLESLQEEPQAFNSKLEEVSKYPDKYWEEKLTSKDSLFAFAQREHEIVGVMNLTFGEESEPAFVAVVHGAYVNRNFRSLGVGKSLLSFLVNEVKQSNEIKVMKLWVKESQTSAIKLYTDLGFKSVSKAGEHTLIMEKHLE